MSEKKKRRNAIMSNNKQETLVQTAIRLPESALKHADKIADRMSGGGFPIKRSEVLRAAVTEGLKALERKKR